jgi:hypothetical protein
MNIITKNMNKMNTIIFITIVAIIPNHALDKMRNPSEVCLPPSRPSLTSYALEYGGALRKIRVSVFSK